MESWYLAYLTDTTNEEREKGKTIEYSINTFNINDLKVNLIDSPGHKNYIQNTIQALSLSDIAILVVSAKEGEFESGFEKSGQTKEHLLIAKGCGINNIIIVINKLDDDIHLYQNRIEYIKNKLNDYIKKININIINYVEISALNNINITFKSVFDEINYLSQNIIDKDINSDIDDKSLFKQIYDSYNIIKKKDQKEILDENVKLTIIEKFQNINYFVMVKIISENINKNLTLYHNEN